jgi:protein-disulfide isomerase
MDHLPEFFQNGEHTLFPAERVYGARDARVMAFFYFNMACSRECRRSRVEQHFALTRLDAEIQQGRVGLVMRPLVSAGGEQVQAASALMCIPPKAAFEIALGFYAENRSTTVDLTAEDILTRAAPYKVDPVQVKACMESGPVKEYLQHIQSIAANQMGLKLHSNRVYLRGMNALFTESYIRNVLSHLSAPPVYRNNPAMTIKPTDKIVGDPKAPIKAILYLTFENLGSKRFHEVTMPRIFPVFVGTGKVAFVYRPYGWREVGYRAAAVFACVPNPVVLKFVENMFMTQEKWSNMEDPTDALADLAIYLGAPAQAMKACVKNPATRKQVDRDMNEATTHLKMIATPVIMAGDQMMMLGDQGASDLTRALMQELNKGATP